MLSHSKFHVRRITDCCVNKPDNISIYVIFALEAITPSTEAGNLKFSSLSVKERQSKYLSYWLLARERFAFVRINFPK